MEIQGHTGPGAGGFVASIDLSPKNDPTGRDLVSFGGAPKGKPGRLNVTAGW